MPKSIAGRYRWLVFDIKAKKICVTGSSGFLGGWICRELQARGASVVGISKSGELVQDLNIPTFRADLRNFEEAESLMGGCDAVVIASAVTSGAQVIETDPLVHLFDNMLINSSLIRAATRTGVRRLVFISSSTVYPNLTVPMTEDHADGTYFHKYKVVGAMKRASEQMGQLASEYSTTEVISVRPGNSYGPFDHFGEESSHVIPALVRKIYDADETLEVWGDGTDIKNFIYAQDLARGIIAALEHGEAGHLYNIGGPQEVSIRTVIETLLKVAGKTGLTVEYDKSKPSMIPVRRIDSAKAHRELGFFAETSIDEGLRKTYEWYGNHKL